MDIGRLNVPPSARVGEVLLKKTFNPFTSSQTVFRCGTLSYITFRLTKNYGLAPGFRDVYTTDIPGIGVRLSWFTQSMQPIPYRITAMAGHWLYHPAITSSIEIIKTSNQTGSGSLAAGVYAEQFGNGDNKVAVRLMLGGGTSSVIVTPACSVPDGSKFVSVPLGKVPQSAFNGVNSTAGGSNFKIRLQCNTNSSAVISTVYLKFDANKKDPNGRDGVILLDVSQASAKGVGIQISDAQQIPIRFGQDILVGSSTVNTYELNYTAKYIQTLSSISPGEAKGTASFTIEYK
ncbi:MULTISPECIES: fimbrial protein [unclassified Pseudomonas]|uniref:fimbrial protein n=1 Tax=unclassified Pseudomonas TaxID=196821 RepID=UPI0013E1539E|nr:MULTISPECIES: fimbrial protein [unclassified Pseudomonas]QIH06202.1 type 1 fimbrial protein [Pseudomonas sp. BIOMIG1BAC]